MRDSRHLSMGCEELRRCGRKNSKNHTLASGHDLLGRCSSICMTSVTFEAAEASSSIAVGTGDFMTCLYCRHSIPFTSSTCPTCGLGAGEIHKASYKMYVAVMIGFVFGLVEGFQGALFGATAGMVVGGIYTLATIGRTPATARIVRKH